MQITIKRKKRAGKYRSTTLNLIWTVWLLQNVCFAIKKRNLFCNSSNVPRVCFFFFPHKSGCLMWTLFKECLKMWLWWSFRLVLSGAEVGSGEVQSTDQHADRSSSPKRLNPRWQILNVQAHPSANVALTYKWTEKVYIFYYVKWLQPFFKYLEILFSHPAQVNLHLSLSIKMNIFFEV